MSFDTLGLSAELLRAVGEQGYTIPTPIQAKAIPVILDGRDVMASAQTGTGKTAGFTLPLLQRLNGTPHNGGRRAPRALVLAPTRELAAQVGDSVATYGGHLPLKSTIVFGGVGFAPQAKALRRGVDILIATPGRLLDHVSQKTVDLSQIEILVLDEADRMLDMGFIPDIKRILALLPHNDDRQNLLFSATFSGEIKELADRLLQQPEKIQVAHENKTAELIEQVVHPVEKARKRELLSHMIGSRNWRQVLVFARTRHGADRLARHLDRDGLKSAALHGDKSQGQRTRALADFKAGRVRVLVATDIAARGLDIDQLPHVVNFELPNVPEDYVHRIGRTGRAGRGGEATSLVCPEEYKLLRDIERLLKRSVPISVLEEYAPAQPYRAEGPRPAGNGRGRGRPNGGNSRGRSNARGGNGNGKANGGDRARSASSHRGQGGQGDKGSQGSQGSHRGQGGGHGGGGQTERNGNVASKRVAEVRPEINGNVATPQNARPAGKPSHKPAGNRARRKAGDGQQAGQHRQSRPGQGRKSGNSRAAFRD